MRLSVKKQRFDTVGRRGLTYRLACDEDCRGVVELKVSRRLAKRLQVPAVLAKTSLSRPASVSSKVLRIRLSRRGRGVLAANRSVPVQLVANLTDDSRNRRVVRARTALRR